MKSINEQVFDVVGHHGWIEKSDAIEPYLVDWRGNWRGECLGVALPDSVTQITKIVKICNDTNTPITPIGGNTGLVGGAVPTGGILISTKRLNKIRQFDSKNQTISVDAGCILTDIQLAATDRDLLFPLSLGSEGSCQIGGNLSTNAGGVGVLKYGNMRDLTLGLEVVLASGKLWNGMNSLRKNNSGYDLKQLFMGAEGTLGIITGAVLKLFPLPKIRETILLGIPSLDVALNILVNLRNIAGDSLSAFEIINSMAMELVIKNFDDMQNPFNEGYAYYALIELSSIRVKDNLRSIFEDYFIHNLGKESGVSAVIAENIAQGKKLWQLRTTIPEAQVREGISIKHDVSIPISKIPNFINEAERIVTSTIPGTRIVAFGHMGDGNIHYNLSCPINYPEDLFIKQWSRNKRIIYDLIMKLNGSFSAEHGIGKLKLSELNDYGNPVYIESMQAIKRTFDPKNIMNPGKVIPY